MTDLLTSNDIPYVNLRSRALSTVFNLAEEALKVREGDTDDFVPELHSDYVQDVLDAQAAVRDMLAALEMVIRNYGVDMQPAHRAEVRAAIAKAKGE